MSHMTFQPVILFSQTFIQWQQTWSRNYFKAKNPSCCQWKEQAGSLCSHTQKTGHPSTSAFPTASALTHPEHSQPFSARQQIWGIRMTQLTQRQLERCELCLLSTCFCHIWINGQKKARAASEMSSGARPAQVHTTEQRRSPVNRCSLLAALVGISCNTGAQTLAVPTKIAVASICVTIFDKRSHINLGEEEEK